MTFILIDDESGSESPAEIYGEAIVAASDGELSVRTHKPSSIAKTLEHIAEVKPDGLFLDIALTNALNSDGGPIGFDGIALAQQIRTMQTRALSQRSAGLPEFPLIRFSKKDVIREYVSGDSTSDDLFDEKIDKDEIIEAPHGAALRAFSLAADYPRVAHYARDLSDEALANLLGLTPVLLGRLDVRVLLGLRRKDAPAHILSRHLVGTLLGRPGPLMAEDLLAVRLGVDRDQSEDWPALLQGLSAAAYRGAFGAGYPRWWLPLVLDWWRDQVDADQLPYRIDAPQRVDALRERTRLRRLTSLREDPDSPGLRFWHICSESSRPVDPTTGFALLPVWGQESWQDPDYLCLEEARRDSRNARLSATERNRLAAQTKRRGAA